MASEQTREQTPVEVPQEEVASEQTPVEAPQEEVAPERTPNESPVEETPPTTDADFPPTTQEAPTTEETPVKPSAKEKITGKIHQTGEKIKATIGGVKEKVTPSSKA